MIRAYSNSVNAAFTQNILKRINRELGGDFNVEQFPHNAFYNKQHHRIEAHLISSVDQSVTIDGRKFHFSRGEVIIVGYSHKFEVSSFSAELASAGFKLEKKWFDDKHLVGILYFRSDGHDGSHQC
eukprot:m.91647 g.91647  ORF g.91647 m.91647 type:complete len:126 (+) comp36699_c0_seq1:353-730(+)